MKASLKISNNGNDSIMDHCITISNLQAIIYKENDLYVASCPQLDLDASGYSVEDSARNLFEVIYASLQILLEDNELDKYLKKKGWKLGKGYIPPKVTAHKYKQPDIPSIPYSEPLTTKLKDVELCYA